MVADVSFVPVDEYLRTSYRPDLEYIDGLLEERTNGSWDHGHLQGRIGFWFMQHEPAWGVQGAHGVRTRISSTRICLPDVVVDWAGPHPPVLEKAPLLAIEVLSPDDTYSALQKRARDYQTMGIPNIWLIDPETRTARSCEGAQWIERERLEVPGTAIYLDVTALFRALDPNEAL